MSIMRAYAGVGSRETPPGVLARMTETATTLARKGWTLRTGGAIGADTAFARGAYEVDPALIEMFLPWPMYVPYKDGAQVFDELPDWTFDTVERFHPAPHRLTQGAHKMMARNARQVLGPDGKDPSRLVVCWTKDGKASGGTGQAIRIAHAYQVPVVNMHDPRWEEILARVLEGIS